jgi:hypothetical protein
MTPYILVVFKISKLGDKISFHFSIIYAILTIFKEVFLET